MQSESFWAALKSINGTVSQFGLLDIGLIVLILFGLLRGYRKGLGVVFNNMIQLVFVVTVTLEFFEPLAGLLSAQSEILKMLARLSAFIVLVAVSYYVSKMVLFGAAKILTIHFNDAIDSLLGALAGAAHLTLTLSLLVSFLLIFPGGWVKETVEKQNLSGPFLGTLAVDVHQNIRQWVLKIAKTEEPKKTAQTVAIKQIP